MYHVMPLFICLLTGPFQKPSVLPTHCYQTGLANHPLHAAASQRCDSLGICTSLYGNTSVICVTGGTNHGRDMAAIDFSSFLFRHDVHTRGQQDIYWQYGQFWENGELRLLSNKKIIRSLLDADLDSFFVSLTHTWLISSSLYFPSVLLQTRFGKWGIAEANLSVSGAFFIGSPSLHLSTGFKHSF